MNWVWWNLKIKSIISKIESYIKLTRTIMWSSNIWLTWFFKKLNKFSKSRIYFCLSSQQKKVPMFMAQQMKSCCSEVATSSCTHDRSHNLRPWWAAEHGPATCPGSRGSQEPPGLYKQRHSQQIKERDYLPLLRLHLDTASSFGSPNAGKTWTNWRELRGRPPRQWGWSTCPRRRGWGSWAGSAWRRDSFGGAWWPPNTQSFYYQMCSLISTLLILFLSSP